jgi:hypothetical protein
MESLPGPVAVIEVGRQNVDMDEFAKVLSVPVRRRVFHRIVADGDDQIGGIQEPVARLIGELSHPAAKILEEMMSGNSAGRLESTDYREKRNNTRPVIRRTEKRMPAMAAVCGVLNRARIKVAFCFIASTLWFSKAANL